MQKYIALGSDNIPLLAGKQKTIKQWQFYGQKRNRLKMYGFDCIISIIEPYISGRNFTYVRINYAKK